MKTTHLNTYTEGGAAEASLRLHAGLLNEGIESKFIALYKGRCTDKEVYDFRTELNQVQYWFTKIKNKQKTLNSKKISKLSGEWYSELNTVWRADQHSAVKTADIVHLHWISSFVDIPSFLSSNFKVVWTLHDHFLFSGGFHYPPPIEGKIAKAKLEEQQREVKNLLEQHPIQFVCPSEHLKQLAMNSGILNTCNFTVIKNPVDTTVFQPLDKETCRKHLNIPTDKKVIFFLSDYIDYKRKGFHLLEQALGLLKENITLITAGRGELPKQIGKASVQHFGLVKDKKLLAQLYNSCDIMVNPSLDDISSNTVIEAMACGQPVVVFNSGGIPELITVNGVIANEKTAQSLAHTIDVALNQPFDKQAIRNKALNEHALNVIAKHYIDLYKKIHG